MRMRSMFFLGVIAACVCSCGGRAAAPDAKPASAFNSRDLSGVWRIDQYNFSNTDPKFTEEGKKRFDLEKPSYGYGPKEAAEHPEATLGQRRAVPPAIGNDYIGACNPLGLIRNLLYRASPMEFVMTPTRIFQFFEWTWDHREIWMDGRAMPKVDEYLPRWNGYSVGRWDGDTLIVTSTGFDDRQWVDHFGYPVSETAQLEERWHRTSPESMELNMTLTDPMNYMEPWKAMPAKLRLVKPEDISQSTGWVGLAEDRCVPLDEVDHFNATIRNPAGGVKK